MWLKGGSSKKVENTAADFNLQGLIPPREGSEGKKTRTFMRSFLSSLKRKKDGDEASTARWLALADVNQPGGLDLA